MKRSICLTLLVILSVIALPLFAQSGRVVPLSEADALTVRITHVNMKEAVAAWEALRVRFGEKYLTVPYGDPDSSGSEYMRPSSLTNQSFIAVEYGDFYIGITPRPEPSEVEKKAREEKLQREREEWKKRAVFFRKGWNEHAGVSGLLPVFEFSADFRFMVPAPPAKTESTPAYRWWGDQPYLVPRW